MSFINHMAKEINCKIVYYGPGLCGKTTNLQHIHDTTKPEAKGKMISLATETERTLFFDFMPLDLGTVRGYKVRFHLYTVPGQVFYDASRKLILKGADGVIFVADSNPGRMEANVESVENLALNLAFEPAAWWAIVPVAVYSFGWSMMTPSVTLLLLDLIPERRGMASSVQSSLGSAVNAAVAGVVAPLVMHSAVGLAATSLLFGVLGLGAWSWVKRRLPAPAREPVASSPPERARAPAPPPRLRARASPAACPR